MKKFTFLFYTFARKKSIGCEKALCFLIFRQEITGLCKLLFAFSPTLRFPKIKKHGGVSTYTPRSTRRNSKPPRSSIINKSGAHTPRGGVRDADATAFP